jgi:hypothetical protein
MNVCVFLGPTLAVPDAEAVLDAVYLPPAKHGDVYRAVALLRPQAIGLIDGYFQWSAAVWHKEILWAIHEGIHVFGSSSMGALRAAELTPFGMRGVGRIFEAYRKGALGSETDEALEDDDEVCVVHGPAESGYIAASEALVNIRFTLADAAASDLIGERTRVRLLEIARALFFPDRTFARLLEQARAEDLPGDELTALERWLPAGRTNQKRDDAIAMLETMREFLAGNPTPAAPAFPFEHTTLWDRAVVALQPATSLDPEAMSVLDELRLDVVRWEAMRERALRYLIGVEETARDSELIPGEQHLERAARDAAERRLHAQVPDALVERKILAIVREEALYGPLRSRAEQKRQCLAGLRLPAIEEFSELQLLELCDWYFCQAVGREMPDDLETWTGAIGYRNLSDFHRSVFGEYVFRKQQSISGTGVDG